MYLSVQSHCVCHHSVVRLTLISRQQTRAHHVPVVSVCESAQPNSCALECVCGFVNKALNCAPSSWGRNSVQCKRYSCIGRPHSAAMQGMFGATVHNYTCIALALKVKSLHTNNKELNKELHYSERVCVCEDFRDAK